MPPPQPPASAAPTGRHYALPPSRAPASPSSLRPPPPSPPRRRRRRHRRRRLLLRAPLAFIESKQASWRPPPSPSQQAPRPPPSLQHPGHPLAGDAGRDHSASGGRSPHAAAPGPASLPPRWEAVGRPGALWARPPAALPAPLPALVTPLLPVIPLSSSFQRLRFSSSSLLFVSSIHFCLLSSLFFLGLPFVLPVNQVETRTSSQTFDFSQHLDLPKDKTFNREQLHEFSCLKDAEKIT